MGKFPTRTLVLMILAVLAFGWFYWRTHQSSQQQVSQPAPAPLQLEVIDGDGGRP